MWPSAPHPHAVRDKQIQARKQARNLVILIIVDHFLNVLRPRGIVPLALIVWPILVKVNAKSLIWAGCANPRTFFAVDRLSRRDF
jgi:hypothetical protein